MSIPKGASRSRKPTLLKVVNGTVNTTRENKREPKTAHAIPPAPPYLTKGERAAYDRFAECVAATRVTTKEDFAALETLACTYNEMQRLRQALRDEDPDTLTYETYNKFGAVRRVRPELVALSDVDRKLIGLLGRFGLTPADRSRVDDLATDDRGRGPEDPEAEFT